MYKYNNFYKKNFIFKIIENDIKNKKYNLICTRFPPEPNGHLHIGHIKSVCLNFSIAKFYKGKFFLRIDDTNPSTENIKYIKSIKKDLIWLGFKWDENIKYTSNYFNLIYKYAVELIKKDLAYVDELNIQDIKNYRGTLLTPGKNSPYRNRSVKENLKLFEKMYLGDFPEGSVCLRAKIDMKSKIIVMRDPVLYRIKFQNHHQTKRKWCIYPTYDFSHCISDAIEGITHSLCTLEFQDNKILYNWILNNINIKKNHPKQYEFSKLNIEYGITSKRNINILIKNKIVSGWDDPRLLTISGLRRKGYTPSSLKNFCYSIGVTKQNNIIEMSFLESCIKSELNELAPRSMAILRPLKIIIDNFPFKKKIKLLIPNHPNKKNMGYRNIYFTKEIYIDILDFSEIEKKNYKRLILGYKVKLRYSFIIKARKIVKDKNNNIIYVHCKYYKDSLGKKINRKKQNVKGIIHWISCYYVKPAKFYLYKNLFIKKDIHINDNILNFLNKKSLLIYNGFIEKNLLENNSNRHFQFEREGYFFFDKKYSNKNKIIFNRILSLRMNDK
ncbi:glutamine--tRNA ligase [Enterobacteriaceae endosymbiont of Donacia bicoloricornis]|uniref:glutamine--tRNA ligase n=1 Tax=Enterobacteriaceae endosymbiont of Donacia bicoloricornis TaxID=2675772 RepID=UPI00144940EC|nr:glutamine--tRNA ligase [Enterobacteriaceae endosymbiont of Donacia bicoloricornis]QJC37817.1 glutamine--tRNA ligase [Enterobacteriaceae endosymbiont of Donacia bicoloricornis]